MSRATGTLDAHDPFRSSRHAGARAAVIRDRLTSERRQRRRPCASRCRSLRPCWRWPWASWRSTVSNGSLCCWCSQYSSRMSSRRSSRSPNVRLAGTQAPLAVVKVWGFLAALRVVEDYVVYPRLIGRGLHLHPLAVVVAVLAGVELGGVAGIVVAVPAVALASVASDTASTGARQTASWVRRSTWVTRSTLPGRQGPLRGLGQARTSRHARVARHSSAAV